MLLAQLSINALALGAGYTLVALGFVLVLNATGAVNFAQGDAVVAGGFMAIATASAFPTVFSGYGIFVLPVVIAGAGLLGLALSLVAYMPLRRHPPVTVFVSTIAVGIILANSFNAVFGAAPRATPALVGGGQIIFGGLSVSRQSLAVIATAAFLVIGLGFLLHFTQLGRRLRATAQDPEIAQALGINVTLMICLSFVLGTALAGTAGLLLANQFFLTPNDGGALMLKAYIAVAIGGWGSLRGAAAGALFIAFFEVFVATWLSQPIAEAGLYLALFAVLLLRPQGLFGEPAQRRA